jgi:hypothetical protein
MVHVAHGVANKETGQHTSPKPTTSETTTAVVVVMVLCLVSVVDGVALGIERYTGVRTTSIYTLLSSMAPRCLTGLHQNVNHSQRKDAEKYEPDSIPIIVVGSPGTSVGVDATNLADTVLDDTGASCNIGIAPLSATFTLNTYIIEPIDALRDLGGDSELRYTPPCGVTQIIHALTSAVNTGNSSIGGAVSHAL